jgi:hypothetical protein
MTNKTSRTLAICGSLFAAVSIWAAPHHSVQTQWDFNKPLQLTGVLIKVEWINPHAYIYLDVTDESGKVKRWAFETIGPAGLRRAGFARGAGSLKVGDTYTIAGFAAKNGSGQPTM